MLIVNYQTATVPDYVLKFYKNYVSDTELLTLLHFQLVAVPGKKGWEEVASNLGYGDLGPLTTIVNRLDEKGAIVVDKYNIDATPLWNNCLQEAKSNPVIPIAKKVKPESEDDKVAKAALDNIWNLTDKANFFQLLTAVKKCLQKITPEELKYYAEYINQWQSAIKTKLNREFQEPVTAYHLTKYLDQWITKGKPHKYEPKTMPKKDFTIGK